jgi:Bacteriodetes cell division protein (FtsL-like)
MESTVAQKMESRQIKSSTVPPLKIKVKKEEEKGFFEKLWQ